MFDNGDFFAQDAFCASGARTAAVPVIDPDSSTGQGTNIPALALFTIRQRDVLDYTVDFQAWLAQNQNAVLSAAVFAVTSDSPGTPTLSGSGFTPAGLTSVVVTPAVGAKPGDAYWIDVTVTIAAVAASAQNAIAIPPRTMVRRINFVVVAG